MMNTFERHISLIDNAIAIKREDREIFTKDFDSIRNYLLQEMQRINPVFRKIYAGPSLFGSFPENLRLHKPDEFDVHFQLKLPFHKYIKLIPDDERPGFVRVCLFKVLNKMEEDSNLWFVYNEFIDFVDDSYYLCRNLLQNWLEDIIYEALDQRNRIRSSDGREVYELDYLKRGTAHTITAKSKNRLIKIDFVPAFQFDAKKCWLGNQKFPKYIKDTKWFAVPKPTVGPKKERHLTFSICAPQAEKYLLTCKYNLKSSLRLLKSIRNENQQGRLKSYFIRTLYLHENENQPNEFWQQPVGSILIHMIGKLLDALEEGEILFYWDKRKNLLDGLTDYQIDDLKDGFEKIEKTLLDYYHQPNIRCNTVCRLFDISQKPLKPEYL